MEKISEDIPPDDDFLFDIEAGELFPKTQEQLDKEIRSAENAKIYGEKFVLAKPKTEAERLEFCWQRTKERHKKARGRKRRQILKELEAFSTSAERDEYLQNRRIKKQNEKNRMAKSKTDGTRIVFDCAFNLNMKNKEIRSAARQISSCYAVAKNSDVGISMNLVSVNEEMHYYLKSCKCESWHVNIFKDSLGELFDTELDSWKREDVVYLSPDAKETLYEFDRKKIYVIGAIVDGHIKVDLTKNQADDYGVKSYKLPLKEFRKFNNFRTSQNITTVFEIINAGLVCGDIMQAIDLSLPNRYKKEVYNLDKKDGEMEDEEEEGSGEESEGEVDGREQGIVESK